MTKWLLICSVFVQSACSYRVPSVDCDWVQPIRTHQEDHLSDVTARQILTHNETGAGLCGWRP